MISIIDASPKMKSNSSYFINLITKNLTEEYKIFKIYKNGLDNTLTEIKKADTLVLVFPLYVDCPPSKLLEFMENINNLNSKKVYAICNCGFLESKHNSLALQIIQNWCRHVNGKFMGSFKIGSGEVLGKKSITSNILSPFFKHKINQFTKKVNEHKQINLVSSIFLSKSLFCFFGNMSWRKKLAKNMKV